MVESLVGLFVFPLTPVHSSHLFFGLQKSVIGEEWMTQNQTLGLRVDFATYSEILNNFTFLEFSSFTSKTGKIIGSSLVCYINMVK